MHPHITVIPSRGKPAPVVFDSPHSGSHYPDDFDYIVPLWMLRRGEDPCVEELFGGSETGVEELLDLLLIQFAVHADSPF